MHAEIVDRPSTLSGARGSLDNGYRRLGASRNRGRVARTCSVGSDGVGLTALLVTVFTTLEVVCAETCTVDLEKESQFDERAQRARRNASPLTQC